jgi:hypothetical protein
MLVRHGACTCSSSASVSGVRVGLRDGGMLLFFVHQFDKQGCHVQHAQHMYVKSAGCLHVAGMPCT